MKIKGEKNCKANFRNLDGDSFFHFRVEYAHPTISVFIYNYDADTFESCFSIEHEMDFQGIFLITGNSGIYNPDQIIIDSFAIYNPHEKVAASHNKHFHEAHKRKASRDMEKFRHDHITTDLLHSTKSFFNKETFGEENLLDMLPNQLSMTKKAMSESLK